MLWKLSQLHRMVLTAVTGLDSTDMRSSSLALGMQASVLEA